MDNEMVVAEAVKVLFWADNVLVTASETEFSEGYNQGFRRGVEHLAEFLVAGSGVDTDWDALVAEAKEATHV